MQYFSVFLINGFLLSITPSTVTDSKCTNPSPVIQEKCNDQATPIPFIQPHPQNSTGDVKPGENSDEKTAPTPCHDAKAC